MGSLDHVVEEPKIKTLGTAANGRDSIHKNSTQERRDTTN